MSLNGNASSLTLISLANGYRANYWISPEQRSAPVYLVAGQRYYTRARQQEAYGGDFLRVAMRIYNSSDNKTPEEIMYQSVRERQQIFINTAVRREIQTVTISGADSGSFRLLGDKGFTTPLSILGTDMSVLATAIVAITPSCGSISVSRTAMKNNVFVFAITFGCPTVWGYTILKASSYDLHSNTTYSLTVARTQTASQVLSGKEEYNEQTFVFHSFF